MKHRSSGTGAGGATPQPSKKGANALWFLGGMVALFAGTTLGFYSYRVASLKTTAAGEKEADWRVVEQAAVRLEAGIRHESIILLRSTLADFDSALQGYVRRNPERTDEERVEAMQEAVERLRFALADHDTHWLPVAYDGTAKFAEIMALPGSIPSCIESRLGFYPDLVAREQAQLAYKLLLRPKLETHPPVDLVTLREDCAAEHAKRQSDKKAAQEGARRAQEAARLAHMKQWPLHVDIDNGSTSRLEVYIDGQLTPKSLSALDSRHFDARQSILLVLKQASREGLTEVKVRRNGASFTVQWQQVGDSAFTDYEADIR